MADVFISYSRRDGAFVRRLHDFLTARGKEAWVDWEDIPPTAEWEADIRAGIEGADAVLFVVSPDSLASDVLVSDSLVSDSLVSVPLVVVVPALLVSVSTPISSSEPLSPSPPTSAAMRSGPHPSCETRASTAAAAASPRADSTSRSRR